MTLRAVLTTASAVVIAALAAGCGSGGGSGLAAGLGGSGPALPEVCPVTQDEVSAIFGTQMSQAALDGIGEPGRGSCAFAAYTDPDNHIPKNLKFFVDISWESGKPKEPDAPTGVFEVQDTENIYAYHGDVEWNLVESSGRNGLRPDKAMIKTNLMDLADKIGI